jgi:hypothetical protein
LLFIDGPDMPVGPQAPRVTATARTNEARCIAQPSTRAVGLRPEAGHARCGGEPGQRLRRAPQPGTHHLPAPGLVLTSTATPCGAGGLGFWFSSGEAAATSPRPWAPARSCRHAPAASL